jgi:hypothetical protein
MVKEFKTKEALDLSSYELEDSELLAVNWREEVKEIELKLRCPVAGWQFKEKRNKLLRSIRLDALVSRPCVEYLVYLTFLGVDEVRETLLSQGHALLDREPTDETWMQSFIFHLEDIRIVRVGADLFRFYLRTEGLELDFNFVDCIHREECVDSAALPQK